MAISGMGGAKTSHRFARQVSASMQVQEDQRLRADKAASYADGVQWTEEEASVLMARNQDPSVINLCYPTLNAISSIEVSKRTDYVVIGKEESDDRTASILTELLNQVMKDNNVSHHISSGFRKGNISGVFFWEVFPEIDIDTQEVLIKILPRKWEEFNYDQNAIMPDFSDARFISREVWLDIDFAKEKYGEKAEDIQTAFDLASSTYKGQEYNVQTTGGINFIDIEARRIAIYEMYYKDPNGRIKYVVFAGDIFLVGSEFGENPSPYKYNYYPYVPYVSLFDKEGRPIGILDFILPIQDSINKALSKQHWLLSSKGVLYEQSAFINPDEAKEEINKPNYFIPVADGAVRNRQIMIEDNLRESTVVISWIQFLVAVIQRISGVSDAVQGFGGTNARSALQESTRINASTNLQTPLIENLFFTKRHLVNVILKMVGQFYTTERVVRIIEPDGRIKREKINTVVEDEFGDEKPFNDITNILRFDVDIREEAPFTNSRELAGSNLAEIIKSTPPEIGLGLLPQFIKTIPGISQSEKEAAIATVNEAMGKGEQDEARLAQEEQFRQAGLSQAPPAPF